MRFKFSREELPQIARLIKRGKVGCLPTDTLYGLVGSALIPEAVEKAYRLKRRDPNKPLIVLFSSLKEAEEFGVEPKRGLEKLVPGPVTLILPLKENSPLRETFKRDDLAIRIPDFPLLRELLTLTGPLFAPSANPQGLRPAENCRDCFKYFGEELDFCVEGQPKENRPSTLVKLTGGEPELLRPGAVDFEKVKEALSGKT